MRWSLAMDLGLKGKIALVTGSSHGLGRAIAEGLAREGARLAICARSPEPLSRAAEEIANRAGVEVLPIVGDVAQPAAPAQIVEQVVRHFGSLHVLVANAGGPPVA